MKKNSQLLRKKTNKGDSSLEVGVFLTKAWGSSNSLGTVGGSSVEEAWDQADQVPQVLFMGAQETEKVPLGHRTQPHICKHNEQMEYFLS